MTQAAFERGDWQAVIAAHPLESHDPAEWLRYGAALVFEQAKREGASDEELQAMQRHALLLQVGGSLLLSGLRDQVLLQAGA